MLTRTTILAQLLSEAGRLREVERLYRKGVSRGDGLAAKNLVLHLLEEGNEAEAMKALKEFKGKMPRPPTAEELQGSRDYAEERGGA